MHQTVELFLIALLKSESVYLKLDSSKKIYIIFQDGGRIGELSVKLATQLIDSNKIKVSVSNRGNNEEGVFLQVS